MHVSHVLVRARAYARLRGRCARVYVARCASTSLRERVCLRVRSHCRRCATQRASRTSFAFLSFVRSLACSLTREPRWGCVLAADFRASASPCDPLSSREPTSPISSLGCSHTVVVAFRVPVCTPACCSNVCVKTIAERTEPPYYSMSYRRRSYGPVDSPRGSPRRFSQCYLCIGRDRARRRER